MSTIFLNPSVKPTPQMSSETLGTGFYARNIDWHAAGVSEGWED